jgi:hypothetical protein
MGNAVVLNRRIYVMGGEGGSCTGTAVQEYDPFSDSWRLVADLPAAHHGIWPVVVGNPADSHPDEIYVAGGAPDDTLHHVFAFSCEECLGVLTVPEPNPLLAIALGLPVIMLLRRHRPRVSRSD